MTAQAAAKGRPTRRLVMASCAAGTMLSACSSLPGAAPGAKPSATGPATVQVLAFNNPVFLGAKDELLDALKQSDAELRPEITVFPGRIEQFREKALAMYSGGEAPDAQWMHPSLIALMASRKLIRPLDELAKRDKDATLSDFYPGTIEQQRMQGAVFGLPWYITGYALAFNRTLTTRMGVTPPDQLEKANKWNWDGFASTLRSLTSGAPGSPDRTLGSDNHPMTLDFACAWVWRNGGDVFSKDLKRCLMNTPAAVDAIQNVADLFVRHQVVNYAPHAADFPGGFESGRLGLRWMSKELASPDGAVGKVSFPLGMAPIQKGSAGRVTRSAALAFSLVQSAPNGDAGWRWLRFMAGPQAAAILMRKRTTLPVRPAFTRLPEFEQSMSPWESKEMWLESIATMRSLPQPVSYIDIDTAWGATWSAILAGKGTVRSLLDDFTRQADGLLANG